MAVLGHCKRCTQVCVPFRIIYVCPSVSGFSSPSCITSLIFRSQQSVLLVIPFRQGQPHSLRRIMGHSSSCRMSTSSAGFASLLGGRESWSTKNLVTTLPIHLLMVCCAERWGENASSEDKGIDKVSFISGRFGLVMKCPRFGPCLGHPENNGER